MKRLIDFTGSLVLILLTAPILIIVMALLVLVERASPLFIQERIGHSKKVFKVYKLRSMLHGEVTSIGRLIRKTGIDELPQLVNILKGDMSFVGPRPLTAYDIERLGWDIPFYAKRWSVRPGLVGLAQLTPVCHKKMSWFYDQLYLKKSSLFLDLKIIIAASIIPIVGKHQVKKWIHGTP